MTSIYASDKKFEKAKLLKYFAAASAILVVSALLTIVLFIVINGSKGISLHFLFGEHSASNPSIRQPVINTLFLIGGGLLLAVPIGVCAAVTLTEYLKRGSKFASVVRTAAETLSGIPSIVYALFGFILFVKTLGWGYSLKAGICTLAIMILPTIMRAAEDSIIAVADNLREASFGLGAGKLRTVARVVVPGASRGIVAAIILSIGRIVSESAAVIFTAGTTFDKIKGVSSAGASLAVSMYIFIERGKFDEAYSAALVLIVCVLIINIISTKIGNKLSKNTDSAR